MMMNAIQPSLFLASDGDRMPRPRGSGKKARTIAAALWPGGHRAGAADAMLFPQ
jgi:hypothetical protein